jgi:hypothetical protein
MLCGILFFFKVVDALSLYVLEFFYFPSWFRGYACVIPIYILGMCFFAFLFLLAWFDDGWESGWWGLLCI